MDIVNSINIFSLLIIITSQILNFNQQEFLAKKNKEMIIIFIKFKLTILFQFYIEINPFQNGINQLQIKNSH